LFVLVGCSAQPYEEIKVWTSGNETKSGLAASGAESAIAHTIRLQADNAKVRDVIRKVAEYSNYDLQLDANLENDFCTVNLVDVEPLAGLRSILDMHDCVVVLTNRLLIVTKKQMPQKLQPGRSDPMLEEIKSVRQIPGEPMRR
jgi:hypothetical protein